MQTKEGKNKNKQTKSNQKIKQIKRWNKQTNRTTKKWGMGYCTTNVLFLSKRVGSKINGNKQSYQ